MMEDKNQLDENKITSEDTVAVEPTEGVAAKVMAGKDIHSLEKKQLVGKVFAQIGLYLFLVVMAVIVLFPFYWMLMSSVKTINEYERSVPTLWPHEFRWGTYKIAFEKIDFGRVFLNTIFVGVVSTILSLVITILSAYAFAKFEFRGKNILFAALLATMMIPGELFTITNYITIVGWFRLGDSYTALIAPFLVSVFYIYLLRQNFMQIPNELYLAAKVDGTSDFKYLWKVMIPLAAPTIVSITILKMMGSWNSYIWPKLVNLDESYYLMTQALRLATWGVEGAEDFPAQMAAVVLVTVPLLIVFLIFRKYIIRGVSRGGTKG